MEEEQVCDGIVVWYNERKGYGFVEVVQSKMHDQPTGAPSHAQPESTQPDSTQPTISPSGPPDVDAPDQVKSDGAKSGETTSEDETRAEPSTLLQDAILPDIPDMPNPAHSEVFLHRTALDRFGLIGIFTGDKVRARIAKSQRGWVITDLISVERTQIRRIATHAPQQPNEVHGIVKFFNAEKGYGFVDIGQLGNDVFVHLRTLRNCGIHHLTEGQHLLVQITDDGKGPQAAEVRLMPVQLNQMDIEL